MSLLELAIPGVVEHLNFAKSGIIRNPGEGARSDADGISLGPKNLEIKQRDSQLRLTLW